jgi:hypothetical protein
VIRHAAGSNAARDGFVATELALGVAVLLVPVAALVLTLPAWSQRQTTGRAIAREVGRAVAREGFCDVSLARGLTDLMSANLGLPRPDVDVNLECVPNAALAPGGSVEVNVAVRMPAVHVPGLGDVGEWSWTARHRQPVDSYGSAP